MSDWKSIGEGVEVLEDGEFLNIRVPAARKGAWASKSGKMRLLGSTGGFVPASGDKDALRVNLNVGFYAKERA